MATAVRMVAYCSRTPVCCLPDDSARCVCRRWPRSLASSSALAGRCAPLTHLRGRLFFFLVDDDESVVGPLLKAPAALRREQRSPRVRACGTLVVDVYRSLGGPRGPGAF